MLVVWLLYGFLGSVYWLLEEESQHEVVGLKLGNLIYWVLTAAVTVVVLVYLFVQIGPGAGHAMQSELLQFSAEITHGRSPR